MKAEVPSYLKIGNAFAAMNATATTKYDSVETANTRNEGISLTINTLEECMKDTSEAKKEKVTGDTAKITIKVEDSQRLLKQQQQQHQPLMKATPVKPKKTSPPEKLPTTKVLKRNYTTELTGS